jgi:mono/diheme cytochrome c family protein
VKAEVKAILVRRGRICTSKGIWKSTVKYNQPIAHFGKAPPMNSNWNRILVTPFRMLLPRFLLGGAMAVSYAGAAEQSDLARNAHQLIQQKCLECHGPNKQDGGYRLDSRQAAIMGGSSGVAIDFNQPNNSELMRRIQLPQSHEEVMPKRGQVLTSHEIALMREWLVAGMPWVDPADQSKHWAYLPLVRQPLVASSSTTSTNQVDAWVANRLAKEGLEFSPPAEAVVLLRRLYLDVVGLPPRPDEVDAFMAEAQSGLQAALEKWVDKLLQSPQYGEKWARPWLDAARYADSHGFQRDDLHDLWAYRDWVIQALNDDMPFDQFTIEQIAGDLLPNATASQRIATGFNRCAPCNVEAGTDPIENRFNQVVDRVNTLGYVWLGTTLECAQCHDHKYDPFTQRDYYGLFAFLNQTELEADRSNPKVPGSIRFMGPYMNLDDQAVAKDIQSLDAEIATLRDSLESAINGQGNRDNTRDSQTGRVVLNSTNLSSASGSSFQPQSDGSVLVVDDPPDTDTYTVTANWNVAGATGLLLETLTDPSLPGTGPGRGDANRPNFVLNHFEAVPLDGKGQPLGPALQLVDAVADFSQKNFDVANAIDADPKSAWAISAQFKRPHWAAFRFQDTKQLNRAEQIQIRLVQNFGGARTIGRFRISALTGDYHASLPIETKEIPAITKLRKQLAELESKRSKLSMPKTLVMREIAEPRITNLFARGDVRSPMDKVEPATPSALHPFRSSGSPNRLALAQWLVSTENSLTPRVIVNRLWQEIFGVGLVATPEDFGIKGERPSHPELLDALAIKFIDCGWSQKKLLRDILVSKTYQQSARCSTRLLELDPQNRLLARGPRFRLPAELIRDNALAIAGRLSLKQFGPPIRPPQPAGLWRKVGGQQYDYEVSPGDDQFRRGIYVVLKRMSPYPSFINFDATARLACRVNRGRSNTPLQALNLLNDPVYVDAARAMVARIERETPDSNVTDQLQYAFRLAVARSPSTRELETLRALHAAELSAAPAETSSTDAQSRAWFAVAMTLLNLDETITKE